MLYKVTLKALWCKTPTNAMDAIEFELDYFVEADTPLRAELKVWAKLPDNVRGRAFNVTEFPNG